MLDYYFCEECETYHQPNRFINGQILSACECEISTQPSGLDEPPPALRQQTNKKQISSDPSVYHNTQYNRHADVNFNYQNSKAIQNVVQVAPQLSPRFKYENIPFRNIIQLQNTRPPNKTILKSPQNVMHTQFLSPTTIRQAVPIQRSVSPQIQKSVSPPAIRSQRVIAPQLASRPIVNIVKPPKTILKSIQQIPVQQISQKMIPVQTPIHTVRKFTQHLISPQPQTTTKYFHPTLRSIPITQERPEIMTSLQNLGPPPMPQKIEMQPKAPSIVLDRVSQSKIQIDDEIQRPVLVLDRVSKSMEIIEEKQEDEDGQCCGKFCYH